MKLETFWVSNFEIRVRKFEYTLHFFGNVKYWNNDVEIIFWWPKLQFFMLFNIVQDYLTFKKVFDFQSKQIGWRDSTTKFIFLKYFFQSNNLPKLIWEKSKMRSDNFGDLLALSGCFNSILYEWLIAKEFDVQNTVALLKI